MLITKEHRYILKGDICPYCGSGTIRYSEEHVYGRKYKGRKIICCINYPDCDSYVGTHEDGRSMGRLANKKLREKKKEAHYYFDKLYKENYIKRKESYKMLSVFLDIPEKYTHIGMFSIKTCDKVIEWSKQKYLEYVNKNK